MPVNPAGIVATDGGVMVIARARAAEVLSTDQQMNFKDSIYRKLKSIEQAAKKFGRF